MLQCCTYYFCFISTSVLNFFSGFLCSTPRWLQRWLLLSFTSLQQYLTLCHTLLHCCTYYHCFSTENHVGYSSFTSLQQYLTLTHTLHIRTSVLIIFSSTSLQYSTLATLIIHSRPYSSTLRCLTLLLYLVRIYLLSVVLYQCLLYVLYLFLRPLYCSLQFSTLATTLATLIIYVLTAAPYVVLRRCYTAVRIIIASVLKITLATHRLRPYSSTLP